MRKRWAESMRVTEAAVAAAQKTGESTTAADAAPVALLHKWLEATRMVHTSRQNDRAAHTVSRATLLKLLLSLAVTFLRMPCALRSIQVHHVALEHHEMLASQHEYPNHRGRTCRSRNTSLVHDV